MKRIVMLMMFSALSGCSTVQMDLVREQEVVVTDPPNKLLEPFICGEHSIDVTHTVKKCR